MSTMVEHMIDELEPGHVVHLEVGDTLEVRLPRPRDGAWSLPLRPRGLVVTHAVTTDTGHRLRFRAEFGVGGLVRFERHDAEAVEQLDLCVTVAGN
jgi:hypothetical protein